MIKRQKLPSQKELKKLFRYDRRGFFVRNVSVGGNTFEGQEVKGSLHHSGYVYLRVNGKSYSFHRIVFQFHHGKTPKHIDHMNGRKADNRIENLRGATLSENQANRKPHKLNSSGVRGVYFDKKDSLWRCSLMINGKRKRFFSSNNKDECCKKCFLIFKKLRGEYVRN